MRNTNLWSALNSHALTRRAPILIALCLVPFSGHSSGVVTNCTEANLDAALSGGGTVTFTCDGTITLTGTKTISINTVLDTSGHSVTISGGGTVRPFNVNSGDTLTLINITIIDGRATQGGAIHNSGTVIATGCSFYGNNAVGGNGGNGADGDDDPDQGENGGNGINGTNGFGGAIYNAGTVLLTRCIFQTNNATGGKGGNGGAGGAGDFGGGNGGDGGTGGAGWGGAIYGTGSLSVTNCSFDANNATGGNAGWGGAGGASAFPGQRGEANVGGQGAGAGIYTAGIATVINSTFWTNVAKSGHSSTNGTDSGGEGLPGLNGTSSLGGGICNLGTNTLINCTFFNNKATGGNAGAGGNTQGGFEGGDGGDGGAGWGGGFYSSSVAKVTNVTIRANSVYGGNGGTGGSGAFPGNSGSSGAANGGNIAKNGGTFNLKNSILGSPLNGGNCSGTITDNGNNISSDFTAGFTAATSTNNLNPQVSALADNGGFTLTCALQAGSWCIDKGSSSACRDTDQRGYLRTNACDVGAFEYNGTPPIPVYMFANGPTASEDGDIGLITIYRITNLWSTLTVNYSISGTASNGIDYVTITNVVTIPANEFYARVFIRPIVDGQSETTESVTLTLLPDVQYELDPDFNIATVAISDESTFDSSKRYICGNSTDPTYHAVVIPVDFEKGVALDFSGGNATNLFPGNPWTTNFYHFNATNPAPQSNIANRVAFQNPIVAFGSRVGGSPIYLNQDYSFGAYAGFPAGNYTNSLRIQVYNRTNWALAGTINIVIPNENDTNQLSTFVNNGFTQTTEGYGLRTVLSKHPFQRWGIFSFDSYILTHNASSNATNYFYVVEEKGGSFFGESLVVNAAGTRDYAKLYVLEFTARPVSRAMFIDQPHFSGTPLPPEYQGKSLTELTNVAAVMPNMSALAASNYLALNGSPELRRHPILDKFVSDIGSDPLALANYVINEIDLIDTVDYDTNYNSQSAVNLGGVSRSALGTFQEGEGSPLEQCALLVYLLRQAGVSAAYVFPTNSGLKMLDFQLSKLMRFQIRGAVDSAGRTNLPQLIAVNYPWVTAYLTNEARWVHIFPWLKDTEIVEGLDLYDYMPTNYNSGHKWLRAFCLGDTNIFSLSVDSDQPLELLPKFIQKNLDTYHPGLSVDDMGVKIINRRNLFTRWDDFPKPFSLSGAPLVWESLKTNLNVFNTIQIRAYSAAATNKFVDTSEMLVADLHNRKLLLRFDRVGTSNVHDMILRLSSYSPAISNQAIFSTSADPTFKLAATNRLASTDDMIRFKVTHKRLRVLPPGYVAPATDTNLWEFNYFEAGTKQWGLLYETEETFRKGDLLTFCFDLGRVSRRMLNVHAEEIWNFNRNANTNNPSTLDKDIYQGTAAYLMVASYFNYFSRFREFNDPLHKMAILGRYEHGYGLIRPQRDGSGLLVSNGVVNLIEPAVHIPANGLATVFNGTLRPDSGRDWDSAQWDWWLHEGVQGSAAEHGALRSYYRTNAISTVKLLQQVGANQLVLNRGNYQNYGETYYAGTKLKDHDTNTWNSVIAFFSTNDYAKEILMTPGTVTNGTYKGVAAFFIGFHKLAADVSGFNGGYAWQYPWTTFNTDQNAVNFNTEPNPDGSATPWFLRTGPPDNTPSSWVDAQPAFYDVSTTRDQIANNQVQVDPSLSQGLGFVNTLWGIQNGTDAQGYDNAYNWGIAGTRPEDHADQSRSIADPVDALTGSFYIDATDLTLPGPISLQVRRNYSSQNLAENEFGFGWKINYVPFLTVSTNSLIYAAEVDGTFMAYRQQAAPSNNVWIPTAGNNPTLNNHSSAGIGSVANLFNNRIVLSVVSSTNVYTLTGGDGSVRTFTERSYQIDSFNRTRPYLDKWQDSRGNFYTFEYGNDSTQPDYGELRRIQSSSGSFLGFYYDVYGHIIETYAGDGRRLFYEYDKYGDLVKVTLPDASEWNYDYQHLNYVTNSVTNIYSTHLIVRELKPDGRILQNDYDSQRRVTNQYATVGVDLRLVRNATFVYSNNFSLSSPTNQITGKTDVYDYTNRLTTYYYTNSLIRRTVDPLNQTEIQDWYETDSTNGGFRRSMKSRTDKRGLITCYKYDPSGNVTNVVVQGDLTGDGITNQQAISSFTYTTNNLPNQAVAPSGTTNKFFYTNTWLLSRTETHPLNASGGNIVTNSFTYYNVTNPANAAQFSFGLRKREVRADGSVDAATNDWLHDYRGFPTNQVQYTGASDPNVTNKFLYNGRNELVERIDGAGRKTRFDYDALGRPKMREVYEAGQTVPLAWEYSYYNENGELVWSDGPRFDPEDYVWRDYDGAGRRTVEIRWRSRGRQDASGVEAETGDNLFATSFSEFDPMGNLTRMINPRGVVTTNSYDALDRLVARKVLENGATLISEGFAYEPGGLVSFQTNALGGVTETQYTSTGKPKYRKSPDGSTNGWRYYLDGRISTNFLSNGAYWKTAYDDAARKVIRTFSAIAATNITDLDRRGNAIKTTDVEGFVFTNRYDGLDRIKQASGPAIITVGFDMGFNPVTNVTQQVTTYTYDASGQVLTVANALGEKTVSTSDALGRPVVVEIKGSNGVNVRVTQTVYATNHHSVTVWQGAGTNAMATTTCTDNDGQPVLIVNYPTNNVWEYVWQRYDVAGNRVERQELSRTGSQTTPWATNAWTYDGLNRAVTQVVRDGATTTFGYNTLGNVTNRAMPSGVIWTATYTNDGRILREYDTGGGVGARTNSYTYYSTGPYAGLLQTVTDGRGVTFTRSYDDLLRLATNAATGPLFDHNITRSYEYDRRGLLLALRQRFNELQFTDVTRRYDAYGQIVRDAVEWDGYETIEGYALSQTWDNGGRRTALSGGAASFLFNYRADGLLTNASYGNYYSANFAYADNGLMMSRGNSMRTMQVDRRDGRGRVLQSTTSALGSPKLTETLNWRGDTRLTSYTGVRTDFTDTRNFSYSASARDLTQETLSLNATDRLTNNYAFDFGVAGGLGVLTSAKGGSSSWGVPTSGGLDGLRRVAQATNSTVRRSGTGTALGAATVSATLNGKPVGVAYDPTTTNGRWNIDLDLPPGQNTLAVTANHPSGLYTTNATSVFTNGAAADIVENEYDAVGNVTLRRLRNSSNQVIRTQSLVWNGFNQLVRLYDTNASGTGYYLSLRHDGLGRRVDTLEFPIISNVVSSEISTLIDPWYDPQVEFLEVGVTLNYHQYWKVYGPDLSGTYGGAQGIGGLEATVRPSIGLTTSFLNDHFGHAVASVSNLTTRWNPGRFGGYGMAAGYQAPSPSGNVILPDAIGWQGKWMDRSGLFYFGGNYYDPISRRWLSSDPAGHAANPSLYTAFNGDPINFYDPDGRLAKGIYQHGAPQMQLLRAAGNWLNSSAEGSDNYWSTAGAFTGQLLNDVAGMGTPRNYVDKAVNFGGTVNTLYRDDGVVVAGSYALASWNVGAIYEGTANIDLATGQEIGDWTQRGQRISGGVASTAGIAAGGLGIYNWATAAPAGVPPVIPTAPRTTFFVTPEGQAIPNVAAVNAPVVTIGESISVTRFAPTAARAEIGIGSYSTTAAEAAFLQTPQQTISRLGLFSRSHPAPGASFFSTSETFPAGSQVQIGTVQPVVLPQGSGLFPAGTRLPGGAPESILINRGN